MKSFKDFQTEQVEQSSSPNVIKFKDGSDTCSIRFVSGDECYITINRERFQIEDEDLKALEAFIKKQMK